MTSSVRRYQTPDCLFGSDSSSNTQADFITDLSNYATNWTTISTTGVRRADAVDRFLLPDRKTVDVRCAAYAISATNYLYFCSTSGGTNRQLLFFSGAGLLNFSVNNVTVSTYQIASWTAGDTLTISWTYEPNPLTTGASDAMRSECHIFNETDGVYEQHVFTHAAMAFGSGALHSFWSTYSGASGYSGTRYMCRISGAFHSSTETFESLVGNDPGSAWTTFVAGTTPRFKVFCGEYLTITPGAAATGYTASPSRTPGPYIYKTITGDCDVRARIWLTDSSGTGIASTASTRDACLYMSEDNTAERWFQISIGRSSLVPTSRINMVYSPSTGVFVSSTGTAPVSDPLRYDFRIVRVGDTFAGYYRAYSESVALSSDSGWIQQGATIDLSASTMPATMQWGVMSRCSGAAGNQLVICEETYALDGGTAVEDLGFNEPFALYGESRMEWPVPTSASGAGDEGEFGGPVYAMAAKSTHQTVSVAWSPIVNEVIKGAGYRDNADIASTDWSWEADGDSALTNVYGELLFHRPVPLEANRLHVRVHVQTDWASGIGSAQSVTVRAYSMSQPGPYHRPGSSPPTFERFYVEESLTSDHGTTNTVGEWLDLGLTHIARDLDGWTYIAIGINHPTSSNQDTRIRAIVVEPVVVTDSDEGPRGGWGLAG